jgi:hypothetical protein
LMARSTEDLATPVAAAAEARSKDIAAGCAGLVNGLLWRDAKRCELERLILGTVEAPGAEVGQSPWTAPMPPIRLSASRWR